MPEMEGKFAAMALRVPVIDGSVTDLVAKVNQDVTVDAVNDVFKKAAEGPLETILRYTEDPIVSSDIVGDPHSTIFDAASTMVTGDNMVKVLGWYDNEWGYSNRIVDIINRLA